MPKGNEIGKYYIQIVPTTDGISGQIESELSKGGDGAEKAGQSIGGKLAAGFGSAVKAIGAAVVTATTAAVAATSKLIKETAAYGDKIDKASQKIGISAEAYQEWEFIAQHSGTSMDSLTTSFKTLQVAAQNGSEAFQALNISAEEAASLSTEDLFGRVIEGLQGMEEGSERTALANQLLGRGTMELGALLNTSAEATEEMRKQVHELGGVMSNEAVKSAAAFQDSLQNMKTSLAGVGRSFAVEFLPSVTTAMDGLAALFAGDPLGAEKLQEGVEGFADSLLVAIPKVIEALTPAFEGILNAIVASLPQLLDIGVKVIQILVGMIPKIMNAIIKVLPTLIPQLMSGLVQIVQALASALPEIIPPLVEALPGLLMSIIDAVLTNLPLLLDVVVAAAQTLVEALPQVVETIAAALPEIIPQLVTGVVTMIVTLLQHLPEILMPIIQALPSIITAINTALIQNLPVLLQGIIQLVASLVVALPDILKSLWDAITEAIKGAFQTIGNLLKSLWETILKPALKWLLNGLIGILNKAIDGINVIIAPLRAIIYGVGALFGVNWSFDDVAIPHIPQLATGGILSEGRALVGEKGPELLEVYGGKAKVTPLSNTTNNAGGITINVYGAEGQDVRALAQAVNEELARQFDMQRAVFA